MKASRSTKQAAPKMSEPQRYLSLADIARILGCRRERVRQRARALQLQPAAYVGPIPGYDESALARLRDYSLTNCVECGAEFRRIGLRWRYCSERCSTIGSERHARLRYAKLKKERGIGDRRGRPPRREKGAGPKPAVAARDARE